MNSKTIRQGRPGTISFIFCFLLFLASCADMFQPKIPEESTSSAGSLDDIFRPKEEEIIRLVSPTQLYVAPHYSRSEIRLAWEGVQNAAYYAIERAVVVPTMENTELEWEEPGDENYETLERFVYGRSYTDEIIKNPSLESPEFVNRYYYRIKALNPARNLEESEPCGPECAMLFRAPVNVKASGGVSPEFINVTWEKSENAQSYEVWRSDFPNGVSASLLGIAMGNQTWFQNKVSSAEQGKDFYYMITAQNGFGNKTLQTRPAYGFARIFGSPDEPNVSLADGSGRGQSKGEIKITWKAAAEPEAYYAVYRYSSIDSSLTRLAEKIEDTKEDIEYIDNQGLKPGIYYYYKVQAIVDDIKSGKALKSPLVAPNETESYILSPPDTVVAEKNSDGTVTVKWKPAIGSEGERLWYTYTVYADKNMNGNFNNKVETVIVPNVDGEGYISADGLSLDDGAFFRVTTSNSKGIESIMSSVVSPVPAAAIIQGATQRAYFQDAAANPSGIYPVKITWKKPANEEPSFYHVRRSTKSGTGFSAINDAALGANGPFSDVYSYDAASGVYTYIDRNETARAGRKFYYHVLSLNQLGQGNFLSGEVIGWGALTHTQYMLEYNKTMKAALKKLTYMYKSGSTDKLGTETKNGVISGTIYYDAAISGLGARIIIKLTNYAEFHIDNAQENGVYFTLNGNSNTSANMSSNGTMDGTVTCTGMYPGRVYYDRIEIKGGAAGGGTYGIEPEGISRAEISWTVGEQ